VFPRPVWVSLLAPPGSFLYEHRAPFADNEDMSKGHIATVQLVIDVPDESGACDWFSETFRTLSDLVDWRYLPQGVLPSPAPDHYCGPSPIDIPDDYEEGAAFEQDVNYVETLDKIRHDMDDLGAPVGEFADEWSDIYARVVALTNQLRN
jgi:hypothetical protein